jgi:hypothetical protein
MLEGERNKNEKICCNSEAVWYIFVLTTVMKLSGNERIEMTTTAKNTEFCIIRTRKYYGPDYQYSLVSEMTREGDETGKVVFETREAAQAALDREQEETTRGYGAYMCAHNESGSPDFDIVSANQSRARRLLREISEAM